MINKVTLIGRLGKDPELKYTQNGNPVCNLSVATSEYWKDKSGQKQEKTEWHTIVLFMKLAEMAPQYLHKGILVYVEGKLQTRQWESKQGEKHYSTEIIASAVRRVSFEEKKESAPNAQSIPNGSNMKPIGVAVADVAKEFGVKQEGIDYHQYTVDDLPF